MLDLPPEAYTALFHTFHEDPNRLAVYGHLNRAVHTSFHLDLQSDVQDVLNLDMFSLQKPLTRNQTAQLQRDHLHLKLHCWLYHLSVLASNVDSIASG